MGQPTACCLVSPGVSGHGEVSHCNLIIFKSWPSSVSLKQLQLNLLRRQTRFLKKICYSFLITTSQISYITKEPVLRLKLGSMGGWVLSETGLRIVSGWVLNPFTWSRARLPLGSIRWCVAHQQTRACEKYKQKKRKIGRSEIIWPFICQIKTPK